jgi:hypothetical protein
MDWHRLAWQFGKTIYELQTGRKREMRVMEWIRWRAFMELEPNLFNPIHYYFAALTAEVARGHSKRGAKGTKMLDRLIKFVSKKIIRSPIIPSYSPDRDGTQSDYENRNLPPEVVERMRQSKGAWFAAAGLDRFGKYRGRRFNRRLPPPKK